jgi:hypothetical protein
MLRDVPGLPGLARHPLDLFRFVDGRPETARAWIEQGVLPWWADPKAKLAFFRPLSSWTHALDHALWPGCPALMHLHSLAWFVLLVGIVGALYRRIGSARSGASLALLLFAIDDAHAPVVGWIANRNALIALCLALPALLVHDAQRRRGFVRGVWLGPFLFAVGLTAGETAVVALAYLVAYAACLDRGHWRGRWGSLLPYLLVLALWRLGCAQLGYGAVGSGVYIDPLRSPIAFAGAACGRLPALGLALIAGPFADFWELYPLLSPALRPTILALALVLLALFARALAPLARRDPRLRFWAFGAALSLAPMCATFPHDRLLVGPGVGAMACIAALIQAGWARPRRGLSLAAALLAIVHLVAAPALAPVRAATLDQFSATLRDADATLPQGAGVHDQTLVLLNPPLDPFAAYLPIHRELAGQDRPRQQLWLATGVSDLVVTTLDAHTLSLRQHGGFLSSAVQRMLRAPALGFERGESVRLDGLTITVSQLTQDGRPLEVLARFERELSDPSLMFRRWLRCGYAPFPIPALGASVVLPRAELGELLFARRAAGGAS